VTLKKDLNTFLGAFTENWPCNIKQTITTKTSPKLKIDILHPNHLTTCPQLNPKFKSQTRHQGEWKGVPQRSVHTLPKSSLLLLTTHWPSYPFTADTNVTHYRQATTLRRENIFVVRC